MDIIQNTDHMFESDCHASIEDIMKELPYDRWPELRDRFKEGWPYAIYAYYVIQNYIEWKQKDPSIFCKLLCPREDRGDGTFFLVTIAGYTQTIYFFTMDKDCVTLKECLRKTKMIDWSEGPFLYSIHEDHWAHVDSSLRLIGLEPEYQLGSGYFWIPKEKCVEFDVQCPPDIYIAPLRDEDITTMDFLWPHRYPGSEDFLRQTVTMNGGLGLYLTSDNSLCAWILKNQLQGLGVLQTVDCHKRKGYGRLLTKALCKKMGEEGIDVHTFIMRHNTVSQTLFKSLGFVRLDNITFEKVKSFPRDEST